MNIEILKKAGIDYDSGLDRFMGDTELYGTVLNLFLADHTMDDAVSARSGRISAPCSRPCTSSRA